MAPCMKQHLMQSRSVSDQRRNPDMTAVGCVRQQMNIENLGWPREASSSSTSESPPLSGAKTRRKFLQAKRSKNRLRKHLQALETSTTPEQVRNALTLLESLAVRVKTNKQYKSWLKLFEAFAQRHDLELEEDEELDVASCAFLNSLYLKGHQASDAEKFVAGLMHFKPRFSRHGPGKIPRTMRALRGMRAACPGRSRIAHPLALWAGMMVSLCSRGHPVMALLVALALSGYLRPSEVFSLTKGDVIPPARNISMYHGLLLFPEEKPQRSKVGTSDNSIFLDQLWVQGLMPALEALRQGCPGPPLWPFTWPHFLREFKASTLELGVKAVPYQLRHSGASIDRASEEKTLQEVMKRGRWSALKSVQRYERATRLAHTYHSYSPALQLYVDRCKEVFVDVVLGRSSSAPRPPPVKS